MTPPEVIEPPSPSPDQKEVIVSEHELKKSLQAMENLERLADLFRHRQLKLLLSLESIANQITRRTAKHLEQKRTSSLIHLDAACSHRRLPDS